MMKTNNFKDYDNLTLYVKKSKSEEIINYYKIFGWNLENQSENKTYEDIFDLTFTRPHKIQNKDELQLLQVYMEERINAIGKLERHKYSKTTTFGLSVGTLSLLLIVLGALFCFNVLPSLGLIGGIIMAGFGLVVLSIQLIIIAKIKKKEEYEYNHKHSILDKEIKNICEKALSLKEEHNA